jgi:4-diphosphocytidyl-2-C-methyl-D-erythritol kinase
MECSDRNLPVDDTNLCLRAGRAVQEELDTKDGVHIHLEKRIPIGAGLGGGSADAAAVLAHLPGYWGRRIDQDTLAAIALRLGSDVPYFLGSGSARGRGRGERLDHFNLSLPYWILLCNPGIHITTGWAYAEVSPRGGRTLPVEELLAGEFAPEILARLVNDLEEPVFRTYPVIRKMKEAMLAGGAQLALMSGSGSTVYGLFGEEDAARKEMEVFRERGWRSFLTPPAFHPS